MRASVAVGLTAFIVGVSVRPIYAANISIVTRSPKWTIVGVDGELVLSDGERFAELVRPLGPTIVAFKSGGGSLLAGLRIGQLIRSRQFASVVLDGDVCASACALAWLGGAKRLLGPKAHFGFHAAYDGDTNKVSGSGNALVGAYLNRLGLSYDAIAALTDASPDGIMWVDLRSARALGIAVEPFSFDEAPAAPVIVTPRQPSRQQQARDLALAYFDAGSSDAQSAIRWLGGHYAASIAFYNQRTALSDVLKQKAAFVARWPERLYAADPQTMAITCSSSRSICVVSGIVQFECRSYSRSAYSAGSATFELTVSFEGPTPVVVGEAGKVLSRR